MFLPFTPASSAIAIARSMTALISSKSIAYSSGTGLPMSMPPSSPMPHFALAIAATSAGVLAL